jgi:hypothetical protein
MTAAASSTPRALPQLLGPGPGTPEALMLLGTPDAHGVVHIRTWTADDWSGAPRASAERAETLLKWLDVQQRLGRTMNQSPYTVRLWLRREGTGSR